VCGSCASQHDELGARDAAPARFATSSRKRPPARVPGKCSSFAGEAGSERPTPVLSTLVVYHLRACGATGAKIIAFSCQDLARHAGKNANAKAWALEGKRNSSSPPGGRADSCGRASRSWSRRASSLGGVPMRVSPSRQKLVASLQRPNGCCAAPALKAAVDAAEANLVGALSAMRTTREAGRRRISGHSVRGAARHKMAAIASPRCCDAAAFFARPWFAWRVPPWRDAKR